MFYTGQKVVCINARSTPCGTPTGLTKGGVYTVARVFTSWTKLALELVEVDAGPGWMGFKASRFRPVARPKTSIEIFKQALVSTKEREPA